MKNATTNGTDISVKVRQAIDEHLKHLVEESHVAMWDAMRRAYVAHNPEKPFKFAVRIGLTIKPKGGEYGVKARIGWGVNESTETAEVTVSEQTEMRLDK